MAKFKHVLLQAHQKTRRTSVGLLPQPPALPDKPDYEVLEWKEKYDEVCKEIENAEEEVKEMTRQVCILFMPIYIKIIRHQRKYEEGVPSLFARTRPGAIFLLKWTATPAIICQAIYQTSQITQPGQLVF